MICSTLCAQTWGVLTFIVTEGLFLFVDRVKERADIIGAFKMEPLYLKHENQESGRDVFMFII